MTSASTHAKKRAPKQTSAEKKTALVAANRRARLQWYALGAGFAVVVVVTLVLITVYTEGELPFYQHGGGNYG